MSQVWERAVRPTHPGEIIADILNDTGINAIELAEAIKVEAAYLVRTVNGHERVTAELALKLSKVLNTSPELWLNMQRAVDLWDAYHNDKEAYDSIDTLWVVQDIQDQQIKNNNERYR